MTFRSKTPSRTADVAVETDYQKYREQLRQDFNCRCGYCDDLDVPRSEGFEIDHFVPKKVDPKRETDYTNLVYACRSCNNAKRAKWPTGNKDMPNDGSKGWIDPCDETYALQFTRGAYGEIVATTDLGNWIYEELKLWKPQHSILWCYAELDNALQEILTHQERIHDETNLKSIITLQQMLYKLLNKLFI